MQLEIIPKRLLHVPLILATIIFSIRTFVFLYLLSIPFYYLMYLLVPNLTPSNIVNELVAPYEKFNTANFLSACFQNSIVY